VDPEGRFNKGKLLRNVPLAHQSTTVARRAR
jgi:hypothetical protein